MDLSQALEAFIAESSDLLEQMEASLLSLEDNPQDADLINAVFRAAHTIKGSAGLFGFEHIVAFTHVVENLLDEVRDGSKALDGDLVSLLFACRDHIAALIDVAAEGQEVGADLKAAQERLLEGLNGHLGKVPVKVQPLGVNPPVPAQGEAHASGGPAAGSESWHLSLRFGRDVLRNGMDPASFLRYLGSLGQLVSVTTLVDVMPAAAEMDPESCYLGFEIDLESEADKRSIESVFEFVQEDCLIRILPPKSKLGDYARLIEELSGNDMRLGEILVASGAMTPHELEEALKIQRCPARQAYDTCPYKVLPGPGGQACIAQPAAGCKYCKPLGEIAVEEHMVDRPVVEAALEKQQRAREQRQQEGKSLRVEAERLDRLINQVGELVIASSGANMLAQRAGSTELVEATVTMLRLVEEVRDAALKLRMVQIGATFERFRRVARDVSRELDKDIDLRMSGVETELDKSVVERIGDPLLHLVRNAMDHGIEPAEVRVSRGKPAKGTVSLDAYHDSGSIVIEVADDGGGLNRERILEKAIERGLVPSGQDLSEQEVYNLIFEPGFSTVEQVSNLSGRGVGMDVVRKNITALRGSIEIESREGRGTLIRIRLPLTLAIIDGFHVGVGGESFVIPLDMVVECVDLGAAAQQAGAQSYINLRGEVLPFLRLRQQFGIGGSAVRRESVVVVRYAGRKAGIVVDRLMGELQTVIKPLGAIFRQLKGIAGSTILGSGEVALILDVPALVGLAVREEALRYKAA